MSVEQPSYAGRVAPTLTPVSDRHSAYAGGPSGIAPSCCIIASASIDTPMLAHETVGAEAHDVNELYVDAPAGCRHAHELARVGPGELQDLPKGAVDPVEVDR